MRDLGHSPRTDYRGDVLSTRIEISPGCAAQMREVLTRCAVVATAVVAPGPFGPRMFVTWRGPAA